MIPVPCPQVGEALQNLLNTNVNETRHGATNYRRPPVTCGSRSSRFVFPGPFCVGDASGPPVLKHERCKPFCRNIHLSEGHVGRSGNCSFRVLECGTRRSKSQVVHTPRPTCFGGIFCGRAAADRQFGVCPHPDHGTLGVRRGHAGPPCHWHGFDTDPAMDFRADAGSVVSAQARSKYQSFSLSLKRDLRRFALMQSRLVLRRRRPSRLPHPAESGKGDGCRQCSTWHGTIIADCGRSADHVRSDRVQSGIQHHAGGTVCRRAQSGGPSMEPPGPCTVHRLCIGSPGAHTYLHWRNDRCGRSGDALQTERSVGV